MADALFASLNGARVKTCTLVIPFSGMWTADVTIDQLSPSLGQQVSFSLAGMTMLGTVYRSGDFLGDASFRIVGGYGGWMKPIKSRFYDQPNGVQLGSVVYDAGFEAGERTRIVTNRTLGQRFLRQSAPPSRLLKLLLSDGWWVDSTGVTQIAPRPTPVIKSAFDVLPSTKLNLGRIAIATDTPGDWLPGSYFTAPTLTTKQVNSVIHTLTSDKLRTEVWTA